MPTRNAQPDLIYRSFVRQPRGPAYARHPRSARDEQLDYTKFFTATGFDAASFTAAVGNTSRQLLGSTQTQWLQQQMAASTATWQVLGQRVLMGRMNIPAPILMETIQPGGRSVSQYAALVAPRAPTQPASRPPSRPSWRSPPSPTTWTPGTATRPRARTVLGPAQPGQEPGGAVGRHAQRLGQRTAETATATPWAEFATSSVTSPGFEEYLPNENPPPLAGAAAVESAAQMRHLAPGLHCW